MGQSEEFAMATPQGTGVIHKAITRGYREDRIFCNLPPAAEQRLSEITMTHSYPKGAVLFSEGQAPQGVFIVRSGAVKLTVNSTDGRTLIVRFSEPGEVLGLPATLTGKPYSLTAEVIEPTQLELIARKNFLDFLREHGDVALRVAQQLGETYHAAVDEMRTLGLSHSAEQKVAHFILDWTAKHSAENEAAKSKMTLTHEEIAETIGMTRETVTRALSHFKKSNLIAIKGATLVVKERLGLECIAHGSELIKQTPLP
jgi:CRP/FNR family cyclic AMP-dependent transcriptional regulator